MESKSSSPNPSHHNYGLEEKLMKSKSSSPNPRPDLLEEEEEHNYGLDKTPLLYSTAPSSPLSSPNPSHKYGYGPDLEEKKEHGGSAANYSDARRHDGKRLHRLRNNSNRLWNNNGLMEKFVFGGFLGGQFKEEETQNPPPDDEDEDNSLLLLKKKKVDEDEDKKKKVDEDEDKKKKVELFNSPATEAFFKKDPFKDMPQAETFSTFSTRKEVSSMISEIFLRPRKKCVVVLKRKNKSSSPNPSHHNYGLEEKLMKSKSYSPNPSPDLEEEKEHNYGLEKLMKSKSSSPNPSHNYGPDLDLEEEEEHGAKFPLSPHCLDKTPLLYSTAPSSPLSSPNPSHKYGYAPQTPLLYSTAPSSPPSSPNPSHKYGYGPDLEEKKEHDGSAANYSDARRHVGKRLRNNSNRLWNNNGLMEKFVFGGGFGGGQFKEEETQNPPPDDEDEDNLLLPKKKKKKKVEFFNSLLKRVEIGRGLPYQSPAAEAFFKKDPFKDMPQAETFSTRSIHLRNFSSTKKKMCPKRKKKRAHESRRKIFIQHHRQSFLIAL